MASKDPVDEVVQAFIVSKDGLEKMSQLLLKQMEVGLAKENHGGELLMLITYVHDLPDGKETGDFLALDLGGCNFRVLKVSLKPGEEIAQVDKKLVIDDATKQSTGDILFDFIAKCIAEFVKEQNIKEKLPLGFTFSFAVRQTNLDSGTLIRWTKDFTATGVVDVDVVDLLREAVKRQPGDINIDVVALVNDTTGTQMATAHKDPNCHVGIILGTGTNACYTERLDAVKKFSGDRSKYEKVIINMEWGAFGNQGSLKDYLTEFDIALDNEEAGKHKREQIYEKMISGKYLGEIVRHALRKLIQQGVLFGGKSAPCFDQFEKFESKYVSMVEEGDFSDITKCRVVLETECGLTGVSDQDCRIVRRVCEAVSTRAARLAAAGIVTIVRKIQKIDKCTVSVDGSLYKLHPQFRYKMKAAIDELAPGNGIEMKEAEDGSGRGAAIIAAVACRLAASK